MAGTAVLAFEDLLHIVDLRSFGDSEDLRMTELTAVPDCVLLMGEQDAGHTRDLCMDRPVFWRHEGGSLYRDSSQKIFQLDKAICFGLHPIDSVAEPSLGEGLYELIEFVLESHVFAFRVATIAILDDLSILAGLLSGEGNSAIMAGAAVKPISIILFTYHRLICGHCKAEIDMT
jgi:hypothetical protein